MMYVLRCPHARFPSPLTHFLQLFTLFYAAVSYIQTRHPYGDIPGQPDQAPKKESTNGNSQSNDPPSTPLPEEPDMFKSQLREFARDIVLKEQQMEHIINALPGLTNSEQDQEKRMRELEKELREVEKEREEAERDRERLVDGLGEMIVKIKRVP